MFVYLKPLIDKVINVKKFFFHNFYFFIAVCEAAHTFYFLFILSREKCHKTFL